MIPIIDGDILRYEIGYAAETGWRAITEGEEEIPPFRYVEDLLHRRLDSICYDVHAIGDPVIHLSKGRSFRDAIASKRPYKGTRIDKKPWHYNNLTVYLRDVIGVKSVDGLEADDTMAIDHVASNGKTIICSRDKDLRQVPGWFYSWELGRQPQFGPVEISHAGSITLSENRKKIDGTGMAFFYAQCLVGDMVDNIPGLPGCGPVAAYDILVNETDIDGMLSQVQGAYMDRYGATDSWEEELLEQGQLLWMTRKLNEDGSPVLWEIGMEK